MKGVGKRKPGSSEVPQVAEAVVVAVAVAPEANVGIEVSELMAGQNDQTQLQRRAGGETQGPDSDAEAEDEEDEGEEDEDKGDGDGADQDSERPKLDEGFYEIEAIRRRRVRKGQLQYFVKWRGWPETANTWEPVDNLQTCSDFIDAFEESLRSGRSRRRKRRSVVPHNQPKKQNPHTSTLSSSVAGLASNAGDIYTQSVPLNDLSNANVSAIPQIVFSSHVGETIAITSALEKARPTENGNAISLSSNGRNEQNDYDPKLSELIATTPINGVEADKPVTEFQNVTVSETHSARNGPSKDNCNETVESSRFRGAKKRKSGSVKRFRKDSQETPNTTGMGISDAGNEQMQTSLPEPMGNNSCPNSKIFDSKSSGIVKIINAIGYSATMSSSTQDVFVSFKALRSDGTEVTVDNKYLKAYDPLLIQQDSPDNVNPTLLQLINFYEQHLRCHP